MARIVLVGLAAMVLAGCATRAPQPDIMVHTGPRDPAYAIPDRYRQPPPQGREQWAGFQSTATAIHQRVRSDPAFGGLVLRWSPEPHAVVMFTGDAEARLRRYTRDPRFRAQRVAFTLAQLEAMKDRFAGQLSRLGLQCFTVDGDEEHNAVTVGAPPPELARIRAAIAAGRVRAPSNLRLTERGCASLR